MKLGGGDEVTNMFLDLLDDEEVVMSSNPYRGCGIQACFEFIRQRGAGHPWMVIQLLVTLGSPVESVINHHSCECINGNIIRKKLNRHKLW